MPPPKNKLPPGAEPPTFTPRAPKQTRVEKAFVAIEGNDEFSVASVDPDEENTPAVELSPKDTDARPEATGDRRTLWRLFRKILS